MEHLMATFVNMYSNIYTNPLSEGENYFYLWCNFSAKPEKGGQM